MFCHGITHNIVKITSSRKINKTSALPNPHSTNSAYCECLKEFVVISVSGRPILRPPGTSIEPQGGQASPAAQWLFRWATVMRLILGFRHAKRPGPPAHTSLDIMVSLDLDFILSKSAYTAVLIKSAVTPLFGGFELDRSRGSWEEPEPELDEVYQPILGTKVCRRARRCRDQKFRVVSGVACSCLKPISLIVPCGCCCGTAVTRIGPKLCASIHVLMVFA
ncbi:unnamed protein product [Nesidiocoris tenuis]|uniref:Uncharacterized protein n=1 Tax=Nesidiocoris tenuis TaxID=355587 RepID=A0A6H5HHJ6_9HEMI|nr:unnamed protein product [Nesidiocoris tenuis]